MAKRKVKKDESPKTVAALLANIAGIIVVAVGGMYAVPRVFSLETDFGPILGLITGCVIVWLLFMLIRNLSRFAKHLPEFN